MPDESAQCCVTSPPYWGLRDYGVPGQLGLERTPDEYVAKVVEGFREVRRVLRKDGTLWLNLGDSYASDPKKGGSGTFNGRNGRGEGYARGKRIQRGTGRWGFGNNHAPTLKPKDLCGIPWMVAFALRADGWYLRQDIIWAKPNPMPESVTDRCTKSHEYLFLLSKSTRYYYDAAAIKEPGLNPEDDFRRISQANGKHKSAPDEQKNGLRQRGHKRPHDGFNRTWDSLSKEEQSAFGANKRSVWEVATRPFPEAHFATFPPKLVEPCILAGCPEGGTVLDPFAGAGTTGLVATRLHRNFIGIELNADYITMARNRITSDAPLFNGAGV
jgi:DNA modification methylase